MKDERKQSVLHPSSFISHPFKKGVINPLSTMVYKLWVKISLAKGGRGDLSPV
jgi:hypothetical protein